MRNTKNKKRITVLAAMALVLALVLSSAALFTGCSGADKLSSNASIAANTAIVDGEEQADAAADDTVPADLNIYDSSEFFESIPEWNGVPFFYVNGNVPSFAEDQVWTTTQESLDDLDDLGRCGTATSCIGIDGMPTEGRGNISEVHPTGWHTDKYDFVEGGALFNRCHLIAHQLSGDDAVPRNLITGTSYMNREGMLPFEEAIGNYVRSTGNHVMYQVTPVFVGDELVARGVHMEAVSVEDNGAGISFNVFCYNVQPGIDIDYATGDNELAPTVDEPTWEDGQYYGPIVFCGPAENTGVGGEGPSRFYMGDETDEDSAAAPETADPATDGDADEAAAAGETADAAAEPATADNCKYVLNTNTKKFHYPTCKSVKQMKEKNTRYTNEDRETIIEHGYSPCGNCHP